MKKTMGPVWTLLCLFLLLTGCSGRNEGGGSPCRTVAVNPAEGETGSSLDDFFEFSRFVFLETGDHCLVGKIDKLQIAGGNIYIADGISKALFVFDGEGRFLRKLDKQGRAENEYLEITDMEAASDGTVSVYDGVSGKLLRYDAAGVLLEKREMPRGDAFVSLPGERIAFHFGNGAALGEEGPEPLCNYACYGKEGLLFEELPFHPALVGRRFVHGVGKSVFYRQGGAFYMSSQLNDTIYSVADDGRIEPWQAYDFGAERPEAHLSDREAMKCLQRVLEGEFPSAPYAFYRHDVLSMILYGYERKRWVVLSDDSGRVLCRRTLMQDRNGLTWNPVAVLDSDDTGCMISAVVSPDLDLWRKLAVEQGKNTDLLDTLDARIGPDSNPVLVFYKWR